MNVIPLHFYSQETHIYPHLIAKLLAVAPSTVG